MNQILLYIGSSLLFIWGIAHLYPTKSIVIGFGEISPDNKRIIKMEWIIEGLTHIFISVLVFSITIIDPAHLISRTVYWLSFIMLNTLALVSLLTGFRIRFLPFRLCPVVLATSSFLILLGGNLLA